MHRVRTISAEIMESSIISHSLYIVTAICAESQFSLSLCFHSHFSHVCVENHMNSLQNRTWISHKFQGTENILRNCISNDINRNRKKFPLSAHCFPEILKLFDVVGITECSTTAAFSYCTY